MRKTLFILLLFTLTVFGQEVKPIALTAEEAQQWAQFDQADKSLLASLQSTAPQARTLSASNAEHATRYLAAMKEIYSAIDLNSMQRALVLAKLQAKYKCEACVVGEDGKGMVRPVVTKEKE